MSAFATREPHGQGDRTKYRATLAAPRLDRAQRTASQSSPVGRPFRDRRRNWSMPDFSRLPVEFLGHVPKDRERFGFRVAGVEAAQATPHRGPDYRGANSLARCKCHGRVSSADASRRSASCRRPGLSPGSGAQRCIRRNRTIPRPSNTPPLVVVAQARCRPGLAETDRSALPKDRRSSRSSRAVA